MKISGFHFLSSSCSIFRGKGALQKRVTALRELRRLLSKSEFPPVESALRAGAIPLLVQCLSFGSSDEQVSYIGLIYASMLPFIIAFIC